jgi:hypothetical protein
LNIFERLNQIDPSISLTHRTFDLRVSGVANHHHFKTIATHLRDFNMDLGDERACGIENGQTSLLRFKSDCSRNAVRRKHHRTALRYFIERLNKDRAALAKSFDDKAVMHDLMSNEDRRSKLLQRPLNDVDCAIHSSAKAPRLGK